MRQNNGYEINYIEGNITVTKSFLKEAGIIGSAAYMELARVRRDLPDFQVIPREIAKKQGKKTYGKLTYKVMESFIAAQEDENASVVMAEYQRVKELAKVHAGQYIFVKTWFLNRYKDVFQQEDETSEDVA